MSEARPSPMTTGSATLFFRNRHLLWLTVVVVLVSGVSSLLGLPRLEDPLITNRGALITTQLPGASAERVEAQVTEVIEEALDEIEAIKDVESVSRAGVSVISVELMAAVEAPENERVFAEMRDKINDVVPLLPAKALAPDFDEQRGTGAFALVVGVSWPEADASLARLAVLARLADDLADRLRRVPGTDLVRVYGEPEEQLTVTVERDELAAAGLTPGVLGRAIDLADAKRPAGVLRGPVADLQIETAGELDTVARVARVPVLETADAGLLTVGDVADVEKGWRTPQDELAWMDGRRTVMVAARVSGQTRVDRWADDAEVVLAEFEALHGASVRIDRVFEQAGYTRERLGELTSNLLAGAGVILLTVWVILGLRPALVVATALPLVVALVLFGWQVLGVGVQQMSIFGLILGLGLLIDNAIVTTDEVAARRAAGHTPLDAVGGTVRHLFRPLLASTATTIFAFAPIMLLPGNAGDFVSSIGTSVILGIAASFAVAMTLTVTLAGVFIRPPEPGTAPLWYRDGLRTRWLARPYAAGLRRLYATPIFTITLGLALPLAGFAVAPTMGNQFFPPVDRDMFEVRLWLPAGTAIDRTARHAHAIEADLRGLDGVRHVSWVVGGSHPSVYYNLIMDQDRATRYAQAVVTTDSPDATQRLLHQFQELIDRDHPQVQATVRQFAQGPPVLADIEYRLFGPDARTLRELGDRYRVALQNHPDVLHTQATLARGEPKLFFEADEDAARLAGLTLADLAAQFETGLEGAAFGSVVEGPETLPVRVRFAETIRGDMAEVASTPLLIAGSDRWVHASALGDFRLRPEPAGISRFNGQRTNTIKAFVRNGALPIDVGNEVLAAVEASGSSLPAGYRFSAGGASEQDAEATANLAAYAPILSLLMVATLVLVFRSVRYALVLGGVAFASVGLAVLSTWFAGFPISFNTILGTLGLIGVSLNDCIVVLAAIRADPAAAAGDRDAVARAVVGCTRHVLATTLTTIGGFVPLLLFVGGDFWPSLAVVFVGGIAGATLVALLFVPAAHLLIRPRTVPA
ncbi:MAG: efflux RND transporter permease subunit [Planctomycetota bacterium]